MIYQCYKCEKLFDEDDGAMVLTVDFSPFPLFTSQTLMVFKCKTCISKRGKGTINKLQEEKSKK